MTYKQKKGQLIVFNIVMYGIILVLMLSAFLFIVTFKPSDYQKVDADQKTLGLTRELISTLNFAYENQTLSSWLSQNALSDKNSSAFIYYDELFTKIDLCAAVYTVDTSDSDANKRRIRFNEVSKESVIGNDECHFVLSYMSKYNYAFTQAAFIRLDSKSYFTVLKEPFLVQYKDEIIRNSNQQMVI